MIVLKTIGIKKVKLKINYYFHIYIIYMNNLVGIDWGTTYSCVSTIVDGKVKVIPNENGEMTSASAIYFDPYSTDILYGNIAKNCKGSFSNLKRLICTSLDNLGELEPFFTENHIVNNKFQVEYNNTTTFFSVEELVILYLSYLKMYTTEFLNCNKSTVFDLVITIPVYYTDTQREITKECATKAGFNVIRIINEPTAAALAYTQITTEQKEENVLVFDCGGGTTDLSILSMDHQERFYQVKNVIGNNLLGGEDLTELLYNYFGKTHPHRHLRKACEKMKRELSYNTSSTVELGESYITLSQNKFLDLSKPFFDKIRKLIRTLLGDTKEPVSRVIFIGGTTRIPFIKEIFKQILGQNITICSDIDPDQTVSIGAATQGALLKHLFENLVISETLLLDIVPLSIGIETLGGIMVPIVSRNTCIPVTRTREFTNTNSDTEIDIHIYQGERKLVSDNFYLTSFKLTVPEAEPSSLLIQVTFDINADSIISATAKIKGETFESSLVITKGDQTKTTSNVNLDDILMNAEEHKLYDSVIANKILSKIELYDSFKKFLGIFHEKRAEILGSKPESESFLCSQLNTLFNETFTIINDYLNYTPIQLKEIKVTFETEWHKLLFDIGPTFKDDETGLIIDTTQYTSLN
jgi:molecular chaperone DnaK (HSP70)